MYHAGTNEEDKTRISTTFRMASSVIRVLIATVAFGMGVDIPDIRIVVHWGLPDNIMQYWQQVMKWHKIKAQV